jgi:hypothetical protein
MSLAAAALAFFLLVALADHWLIRGGFGAALRFALFAALVLGAGYYFVKKILPALLGRVNPVYAAQTIERSRPTLKNSLINFLLFRQKPESVPGVVYKALQEQAATGLTRVSIESAVDRTRMIHLGYILIAFLTAFALYFVLSPKNPFVSAQRIILPWTDVPAPSRVSIQDILPRETTVFRGQSLEVSAIIDGLASGDVPQVLYTTADRQIVDRGIPLTVPQGYRHVASLPESKEGLQQDVAYRIEAGDAISGTFHVHVIDAPTIVVDRIDYKYPAYAGREPNPFTIEHRGDIKELEGTQVTIHATANQPIKSGFIDLGCDRKADVKLKIDGKTATAGFVLALDKERKGPLYDSYQLLITNDRNMENAQPIKHRIEVIADLAPEVAILAPEREEVSVPLDGQATIELRARDPDFALSEVRLKAKTDRGKVLDENLLSDAPYRWPFTTRYQFVPAKLGLKPGDVVAYQAIATDNKAPEANETATSEKRIKITAPQNPNPPQPNQQPNNQQQNNDRRDGQSKNQDSKSDKGQSKGSEQQRGNQQDQNNDQKQGADQKQQGHDQQKRNDQGGDQQKQGADQQKQNGDQKQNGNHSDQQNADGQKQQGDSKQQDQPQKDDGQKQPAGQGDNSPQNGQSKPNDQQQSGNAAGKSEGAKGGQQSDRSNQDQSKNDAQGGGQHDQSEGGQNQPNGSQQQSDGKSSDSSGQPNKDQGQGTGDKGQAQGKGQSAKDHSQSRAPADGQDDGNALERILNHDQKDKSQDGQKGQSTNSQNNQSSGDQRNQSAENQNTQSRDGQKRDSAKPGDEQKQPGEGQHSQQQTGDGQQAKDKGQGTKDQQGQNADGQKRDSTQPGDQQKQSAGGQDSKQQTGEGQAAKDKGQGTKDQTAKDQQAAKPQADQNTKSDQGTTSDKNDKKDGGSQGNPSERPSMNQDKTGAEQSPSASRDNSNSNSGAGQKNQDGQGSPENQRDAKPHDKTPDPGSKSSEPSDPQSPGTSQNESDSRGDQGGDQSGGGQSGGGQKADKPGKGQSGQNTASDQGAGKASEQGKGEDSKNPGTDKKSDQATGQSGTEKGNGSKSQAGQQPDEKQGPKDQGQGDKRQGTNDEGQKKGEQGERTNRGGGSGNSGNIDGSPPTAADKLNGGPAAPIEDPNLAYAKKATELALDRLKKALKASDNDNLLRDLGWSRAEAEEFVKRQEERLQNANLSNRNDDRRRQAEDVLRSLGLRPDRTTRGGGNVTSDNTRGLSSDRRTAPPPEYAQQFKAYQQGVNQSGQNGK